MFSLLPILTQQQQQKRNHWCFLMGIKIQKKATVLSFVQNKFKIEVLRQCYSIA